ncbi:unnamed protein product, partial [Scytosiphon promiscuus]
ELFDRYEEEQICPICVSALPGSGRGIVPCGHTFCFACIHSRAKVDRTCPCCGAKFCYITKVFRKTPEETARVTSSRKRAFYALQEPVRERE